jgi:pimeloyl-ACP methyl ester carboxylesterase
MKLRATIAAVLFGVLAYTSSALAAAPDGARYAQPGELVDVGGHRLNLYCTGGGGPTVVFDSGWEDWAPAWVIVQPAIARYTRACTYDRAGSGFSDPGPLPRTSVRIADELHAALHAAHIPGPYILVGHSFGSYNTRVFADRYMPEVAGLVLVDGENGDVETPAQRASDDREYPSITRELLQCRNALESGRALPKLPTPKTKPPMYCNQQFFRGIPERKFSAALNATILDITKTKMPLYTDVVSEMAEMPWDERYLIAHRRSFGSRPVRVLTAQNHHYDTAKTPPALHRKHLQEEREEALTQARWLSLSSNAKQIFAYKSGHYIELDQPDIVIRAIRDELRIVRASRGPQ